MIFYLHQAALHIIAGQLNEDQIKVLVLGDRMWMTGWVIKCPCVFFFLRVLRFVPLQSASIKKNTTKSFEIFGCVIQPLKCDRHWEILSWAWTRTVSARVVAFMLCRCETPNGQHVLRWWIADTGWAQGRFAEGHFQGKTSDGLKQGNRPVTSKSSPKDPFLRVRPAWRKFLQTSSKLWRLGSKLGDVRCLEHLLNLLSTGMIFGHSTETSLKQFCKMDF